MGNSCRVQGTISCDFTVTVPTTGSRPRESSRQEPEKAAPEQEAQQPAPVRKQSTVVLVTSDDSSLSPVARSRTRSPRGHTGDREQTAREVLGLTNCTPVPPRGDLPQSPLICGEPYLADHPLAGTDRYHCGINPYEDLDGSRYAELQERLAAQSEAAQQDEARVRALQITPTAVCPLKLLPGTQALAVWKAYEAEQVEEKTIGLSAPIGVGAKPAQEVRVKSEVTGREGQ